MLIEVLIYKGHEIYEINKKTIVNTGYQILVLTFLFLYLMKFTFFTWPFQRDYRRQILTSEVDPRTERIRIYNGRRPVTYSNEVERAN